jgi:hypothetical protein
MARPGENSPLPPDPPEKEDVIQADPQDPDQDTDQEGSPLPPNQPPTP